MKTLALVGNGRPPFVSPARRFASGAAATALAQMVTAVGQILLVPAFLSAWGQVRYGEWLALSAAAAWAGLLEAGVPTYVGNRLNAARARGEHDEYARTLHSALLWTLGSAVVGALLAAAAAFALPLDGLLGLSATGGGAASMTAVLLVLAVLAALPAGVLGGVYRTVGEYARGQYLACAQRLLTLLVTLVALAAGAGLPLVALLQLVPLAAATLYTVRDLRRRHPQVPLGLRNASLGLAFGFLGPSLLFLLVQFAQVAALHGGTLLAGALGGAGGVVVFVTLRTPANLVRQITGSVGNALWPELTELEARERWETLRSVHLLALKATLALTLAIACALHFAGRDLVALWTGGQVAYDPALMDALLVLLVAQAPWMTSAYVLLASNRHRSLALRWTLGSALGLLAGWLLARAAPAGSGLAAMVWGMAAADLLVCGVSVPWSTCRAIGQPAWLIVRDVLLRGTVACAPAWLAAAGVSALLDGTAPLLRLLVVGGAAVGAFAVASLLLWLRADERARLSGLLRRTPWA